MAKSWSNEKEMEEVYRQNYEDLDYDEDVDEGKEDVHLETKQEDVWIEQEDTHQETEQEDVWIEQEEDIHQESEQEDTHQETEQEDVRIVIREKERRRQEKEDERYHQVMREADEDLCVPMCYGSNKEAGVRDGPEEVSGSTESGGRRYGDTNRGKK
ncbi:unnamed protein product [Mytilus coruscus]|uniref:Uncharacterized protein n=1 Tax=Mytilus coruscus TaxID=42192 RepID=A0A6J8AGP7_MYTCO|nr:unnamed protein product [Mytilus coruscus]